jgi:hypothetical protein
MSKGYQSYDRRRKDLAFGGRLVCLLALTRNRARSQAFEGRFSCLLALTHGRVLGAGFRMSIPLLFGFNSWPCARCRLSDVDFLAYSA